MVKPQKGTAKGIKIRRQVQSEIKKAFIPRLVQSKPTRIILFTNANSPLRGGDEDIESRPDEMEWTREFHVTQEVFDAVERFMFDEISGEALYSILVIQPGVDPWHLENGWLLWDEPTKKQKDARRGVPAQKKETVSILQMELRRAAAKKNRLKGQRVRELNPNPKPTEEYNVDLNAGGHCAINVLAPVMGLYSGENGWDFVRTLENQDRNHIVLDRFGRDLSSKLNGKSSKPIVKGVITEGHFYPLSGAGIILRKKRDKFKRVNFKFPQGVIYKSALEMLKMIKPMSYNLGERTGFSMDKALCYYSAGILPGFIGVPTLSDYPRPFSGHFKEHNYYIIKLRPGEVPGVTTNVARGSTVLRMEEYIGRRVEILLEYNMSAKKWDNEKIKEYYSNDENFEEYKRDNPGATRHAFCKQFNFVVGWAGRAERLIRHECKGMSTREIELLTADMEGNEEYIGGVYTRSEYRAQNTCHVPPFIKSIANDMVLDQLIILKKLGVRVIKIKTDEVSVPQMVPLPKGWTSPKYKHETWKESFKEFVFMPETFDNLTFTGKTGTGKSTRGGDIPHGVSTSSFGNKAEEIGGMVVSRLFDCNKHGNLPHLDGKDVWCDEFGVLNGVEQGRMLDAYYNQNTRFVFSGDTGQLGPVGEIYMRPNPFLGTVTELTEQHRSDPRICEIRDNVRKFEPEYEKGVCFPDKNLCYTRRVRDMVNASVMNDKGMAWGDVGLEVISNKALPGDGIVNGKRFKIERVDEKNIFFVGGKTITKKKFNGGGKDPNFLPGYATTVHKAQGTTISSGYVGVHEWELYSPSMRRSAIGRCKKFEQYKFYNCCFDIFGVAHSSVTFL